MKIANNVIALNINNNMGKADKRVGLSMGRLSSGVKIARAKDDAAGYAISKRLDMQVQGYTRGSENAYDGVSLIQTTEAALDSIQELLQRCREISVQAANDTNSDSDKRILQNEISEYQEEIDSICKKTTFNGIEVLNGQAQRMCKDADSDYSKITYASEGLVDGTLKYTIASVGLHATVLSSYDGTQTVTNDGTFSINGSSISVTAGESADSILTKIIQACDDNNIKFDSSTGKFSAFEAGSKFNINFAGDTSILSSLGIPSGNQTGTDAVVKVDGYYKTSDGSKDLSYSPSVIADGNKVSLYSQNNEKIEITVFDTNPKTGDLYSDTGFTLSTSSEITNGGQINLQLGGNKNSVLGMYIPEVNCVALGVKYANVSTQAGAEMGIGLFEDAINEVSDIRAKLGAYENRLTYSANALDVANEATTTSVSRIRDTDMAKEMALYTKDNVMFQAGNSLLAQANQRPQLILQLIQ